MILVSWVTPLILNGPDSNFSYSIDVEVGQNVTSYVIGHVPGSLHNEYNVTNLAPYTTYKITVRGRRQPSKDQLLQGLGTHLTGSTLQLGQRLFKVMQLENRPFIYNIYGTLYVL